MSRRVRVAAGVIYSNNKKSVLLSRRKHDQHLPNLWEFPGGKIESHESAEQALERELSEELGIKISCPHYLMTVDHDYKDKNVSLEIYEIFDWQGKEQGREGQQIEWVSIESLRNKTMPEANLSIVNRLLLSDVILISKDEYADYNELLNVLENCIESGLSMFQLRLKDEKHEQLKEVLGSINRITMNNNVSVILNGSPDLIDTHPIDGIHLNSQRLKSYDSRPISKKYLLSASCHNQDEIAHALKLDVDYLFISPVKPTQTHVEAQPLYWDKFADLCRLSKRPVYALGGMTSDDMKQAKANGAKGIAMISAVWRTTRPANVIRQCFNALD